ncbi:hypothetical protein BCR32DRAFT_275138 [Anaeromyces robustus]|uniref:G-protein coupled receptors family 3 profile domain-containing protein n=1 Tax=Anaeromyces robustus TaxID=1754192 RepID=A0A1Y1XM24_9FUNG|nr:hypothetical protein BCR32DRAFT_275138 [Anaeromyces robustus]|eukprot:ORX86782.1 hypothetical protein BCR32DRAFT_275138 [Anaeromyces robustus]
MDENAIFLNYWVYPKRSSIYKIEVPPGAKKGISGSISETFNVGINKYIKNNKQIASQKFIEYITSKDIQRKFVKKATIVSLIKDIYYEEEVCKYYNCELYHSIQLTGRPINKEYENYSEKFRKFIYEFLYGKETAANALKKANNLKTIHYISLNTKDNKTGFVTFIFLIIITCIMLLSLIFLFIENYNPFFKFLPQDLWIMSILGNIFIIGSCFIKYGEVTNLKCYLNTIFLSFGFTISYSPILYKLIINFSEENKKAKWISEHKYLFFSFLFSIDILIFIFSATQPFNIINKMDGDGIVYQTCEIKKLRILIYFLMIGYKFIFMFTVFLFMFLEWNVEEIHYDLKFIISGLYIIIISIFISFVLKITVFNDFKSDFLIRITVIMSAVFFNYFFLYGYRIILGLFHKKDLRMTFINQINKNFINSGSTNQNSATSKYKSTIYTKNFEFNNNNDSVSENNFNSAKSDYSRHSFLSPTFSKFLEYHNRKSLNEYKIYENYDINTTNHF